MRVLLRLLVVLAMIVVGAWIGGEVLLARRAAALIAEDPQLDAAAVHPLRDARRIGLRVERLTLSSADGGAALPWLDLWVPPQRLNEVRATLPPRAEVRLAGRTLPLALEGGALRARFAPAHAFTLGAASLHAEDVALSGQPVARRLAVAAQLARFGSDAPRAAGAAYQVTADLQGLDLATLSGGAVSGSAAVSGTGRLWLDRVPLRGGSAVPPRLVGVRADGLELRLDDLTARLWGRVVADAKGRAEGSLAIDTADAEGFIARAADLGLLPRPAVPLVTAALGGLAGGVAEKSVASAPVAVGALAAPLARRSRAQAALPPSREGELRIPISFRDGKAWLGPLALGPAPRFPG